MKRSEYQYMARDVTGFISQLVRYVTGGGHYFYLRCVVPQEKCPHGVAEKLIARYGIRRKRWQRKRRHLKETASIHYLAYRRTFVIILSKGKHRRFYADHGKYVQDIRRTALKLFGYSIRYTFSEEAKDWKVFVRLDAETYRQVRAHMLSVCVWNSFRDPGRLEREFGRLPYESYAPVYSQLLSILGQVNRERRRRGFPAIKKGCIRKNRRLGKVFVDDDSSQAA